MGYHLIVDKRFIRLAYAIEFPLVLIAFFMLWREVAGESHLELIFWYWKLGIGLGVAWAAVKATAAAISGERAWNVRTVRWVTVIAVLMLIGGLVTYYGHLYYEDQGDGSDEEQDEPAITVEGAGQTTLRGSALRHRLFFQPQLGEGAAHAHLLAPAR
jgi:hypothetical protein